MARTLHKSTDTQNSARTNLKSKAFAQKKAKSMLAEGKSYGEIAKATGISRSTLQYQKKKFVVESDEAKVYPPALRKKIVCSVLNYVHKELLKKPRVYIRRPNAELKSNNKIIAYKEVRNYLKEHWRTAHAKGELPLQSADWIPKSSSYYKLAEIIPSPTKLRNRMKRKKLLKTTYSD